MKKYIKKIKNRLYNVSVNRSYIVLVLLSATIIFVTCFSFALFTSQTNKYDVVNTTVGTLEYTLESPQFNDGTNNVTVSAKEETYATISLINQTNIPIKYELYYTQDINNLNVYKIDGENITGTLDGNAIKTIELLVDNQTSSSQTISFALQADYEHVSLTLNEKITDFISPEGILVDLDETMVPITYSSDHWVVADEKNNNNSWYDYSNKKWANAVSITTNALNNNVYINDDGSYKKGTSINDNDVMGYFVYIPRYKYKLWNTNSTYPTDSFKTKDSQSIEIIFENKYTMKSNGEKDDEYLTHPAFTSTYSNGESFELNGFWVGKFETSYGDDTVTSAISADDALNHGVYIKPNQQSLRWQNVFNQWQTIEAIDNGRLTSTGVYYPNSNHNLSKLNSHLMTNMDWGAVVYLSHSINGTCNDSTCVEVMPNTYYASNNDNYKTGCGPSSVSSTSTTSTCNSYSSIIGMTSSTTQNIYGIYDMSGGSSERLMGNMKNSIENFNCSNCGNDTWVPDNRYYNPYNYGETFFDIIAFSRGQIGDATKEVVKTTGSNTSLWNNDLSNFVYKTNSWILRGGDNKIGGSAGIFAFDSSDGSENNNYSSRVVLSQK